MKRLSHCCGGIIVAVFATTLLGAVVSAQAVKRLGSGQVIEPKSSIGTDGRVVALAFSPDGKTLAAAVGKKAQLWDIASGDLKLTMEYDKNPDWHTRNLTSIAFSPSGNLVATGGEDQEPRLWDPETGEMKAILHGHKSGVQSVAFSPDGKTLASGS